ncbi:DUF1858 domain-containing protein [Orenia marismortui]|uniref:Hybrid cluster-associated redox disulfide protein n=1 Tax=Orenia marismortui TaxID=46469 RepID=A0A4R8GZU2_9FIRM|nr:DUF1858 domain-containing protein [Orenia marismortui]TDX52193.1 hybrid cluster-associated redox disulfide protein [Orenia marismortui]
MKVNKEMPILEILQKYPEANEVFISHGLGCAKCLAANYENLETVARVNEVDIELLLQELDNLIKNN